MIGLFLAVFRCFFDLLSTSEFHPPIPLDLYPSLTNNSPCFFCSRVCGRSFQHQTVEPYRGQVQGGRQGGQGWPWLLLGSENRWPGWPQLTPRSEYWEVNVSGVTPGSLPVLCHRLLARVGPGSPVLWPWCKSRSTPAPCPLTPLSAPGPWHPSYLTPVTAGELLVSLKPLTGTFWPRFGSIRQTCYSLDRDNMGQDA